MTKRNVMIASIVLFVIALLVVLFLFFSANNKSTQFKKYNSTTELKTECNKILELTEDYDTQYKTDVIKGAGFAVVPASYKEVDYSEFSDSVNSSTYRCSHKESLYPILNVYKKLIRNNIEAKLYNDYGQVFTNDGNPSSILFDGVDTYYLIIEMDSETPEKYYFTYTDITDIYNENPDLFEECKMGA